MKKAYIYMNYRNVIVLKVYLDVIKEALSGTGYNCEYIKTLDGISKKDLIVFPMGKDAFRFYHKGYRNIILWQQGATGAESYMRHSSKIRRGILNYMDCFAMKKAKMIFYVSQYMKEYYEKLAHTSFEHKAYIMPCFNETLNESVFDRKDYSKKTFTYVGSLDLWQCFRETVGIYAQIEEKIPDAFLKVLTFQMEKAEEILKQYKIKNYSVSCVPKEQVKKELEDITYGFVIRRDIDVNRVATPTKISSYLSAGVIPIYSTCLDGFNRVSKDMNCAIGVQNTTDVSMLLDYIKNTPDGTTIRNEISEIYNGYYNTNLHIQCILNMMRGLL